MKKIFCLFILLSALFAIFAMAASAENVEYFYVNSATGDDSATARDANRAVKTFTQACRFAEKSNADTAYIVITDAYSVPNSVKEIVHTVPFVITTKDSSTDFALTNGAKLLFGKNLRYILNGDTTFENITIDYSGTLNCVAQYNHITFGDGVVTNRTDSSASGIYVVGGWQSPEDSFAADLDSHITVKSGSFLNIIGGCRQKAENGSGLDLSGTHYIDISGGDITNVFGASVEHNWSQNAVMTMTGGKVGKFNTGGDSTRRLKGTADLTLSGGEIGSLNINNVVGNATVRLLGTKVGSVSVSYANADIEKSKTNAKSKKALIYDANYYSAAEIAAMTGFDSMENNAVVFAKEGATGSGLAESSPASFETALKLAGENNALLTVIGKITLRDFTEPAHENAVTVTGKDGAEIVIGGTYTLGGETVFDRVKISGGKVNAENGEFVTTENTSASGITVNGNARLAGGTFPAVTGAAKVVISGAAVTSVTGGSGSVSIEIHSGKVGTVKSTDTAVNAFSLTVSGGSVDKVIFNNVTKSLSYTLMGGNVAAYEVSGNNAAGSLILNEQLFTADSLGAAKALFTESGEKVFFLADGAAGSGASVSSPSSSLDAAYAALGESGGTVVVCAPFTVASAFNTSTNKGKITFTSVYGGVDYQKTDNAKMLFTANFYCGGETEFAHITLKNNAHYRSIYANTHKLVLGDGISSLPDDQYGSYLSVMGGNQAALIGSSTDVTINSGTWQRVRGGTAADGSKNATVNLTINGGEFIDPVTLGSSLSHDGKINAAINGGIFYKGITASTLSKAEHYFTSDVTLTINGGIFYSDIAVRNAAVGTYGGSYTLNICGGNFAHVTDILGTDGIDGMRSTLNVADSVNPDAEMKGTYSFTNPIRTNGADPWLFYCDGYYYYTATGGSSVGLCKTPNIGDMRYATYKTIYDPEDGHEWSKNLWSPEIHYYTDAEIGAGNGGWYLFLACDSGENKYHRMYVLKCLDGNDLFGRWGNPVTGEVNVPQKVEANDIPEFNDLWAAGMSEIRIGGKLYMLYITEIGDAYDPNRHQTINIIEMTNPWTIVGRSKVICEPEYDWEKHGYAKNTANGTYWPMVVEGSTAVYGKDGSVYIIYSGSGYWTTHYNLAQLKYIGGDPLEKSSWQKSPQPILYKSDSINGCGHASYVTDTDGQGWVCYHAYIGKDTSSGRYAFVEPYTADKNGVVIADGNGHPAPIETVYTANVNPLPLSKRIRGFENAGVVRGVFHTVRTYENNFTDVTPSHWFAPFVKNAYELKLANGTSGTKFSPDASFTVAQALTAAVNIHTAYYGTSVRAGASGEAWYVPYVEYCVQNGIIEDGQFANLDADITRGDMAIVFANILPQSEYGAVIEGTNPDVPSDMACHDAVAKLFRAGIVGGDAGSGNYRPGDSIKRSEACVIFTRIAMRSERIK